MYKHPRLTSVKIKGYRPFRDFVAPLSPLEVIVGSNGSGKSCLFEFLKFLRDGMQGDIPSEIIPGSIGQQIFHIPGPEKFTWDLEIDLADQVPVRYQGELTGPRIRHEVSTERVESATEGVRPFLFLDRRGDRGFIHQPAGEVHAEIQQEMVSRRDRLALGTIADPRIKILLQLGDYIRSWRFYSTFNITTDKIRKPVLVEPEPWLDEDGGNLSAVLHYLMTEHPELFDQLQLHLRGQIRGFQSLTVKARSAPGEVMTFWREQGCDRELSLADLSDGSLRLICWFSLCLHPNPPSLICIDEPEQGLHPRTFPVLAAFFDKASWKHTQIFVTSHGSFFLLHFDFERIALLRKENGAAKFLKPAKSKTLTDMIEDLGIEEIEYLHWSDHLEVLS
ncbi:MAG: AAA family ATPase [Hormoscilla sp. SP5CHS1]|nr:AAA family ATPase [Hormoscilla sp. SP5CHS1]